MPSRRGVRHPGGAHPLQKGNPAIRRARGLDARTLHGPLALPPRARDDGRRLEISVGRESPLSPGDTPRGHATPAHIRRTLKSKVSHLTHLTRARDSHTRLTQARVESAARPARASGSLTETSALCSHQITTEAGGCHTPRSTHPCPRIFYSYAYNGTRCGTTNAIRYACAHNTVPVHRREAIVVSRLTHDWSQRGGPPPHDPIRARCADGLNIVSTARAQCPLLCTCAPGRLAALVTTPPP